jgi:hypothetical protein
VARAGFAGEVAPPQRFAVLARRLPSGAERLRRAVTGKNYMASYDAYDQEGANGPGYYLGHTKLKIITPQ